MALEMHAVKARWARSEAASKAVKRVCYPAVRLSRCPRCSPAFPVSLFDSSDPSDSERLEISPDVKATYYRGPKHQSRPTLTAARIPRSVSARRGREKQAFRHQQNPCGPHRYRRLQGLPNISFIS